MVDNKQQLDKDTALHLQMAMDVGNVAWWEMELPSGLVRFNENKAKMIGFDPKDFTHYQDFTKLVHPEDYEKIMQAMRDHINGIKDVYETEYRIQTREGGYKWFYDRGKIVERKEGGYIRVIGVVQNITDLKESIIALEKKTKELEEMNALMVGRELRIAELKKQVETLQEELQKK